MRVDIRRENGIRTDIFTYDHVAAAMDERTVRYPAEKFRSAQESMAFEGQSCSVKQEPIAKGGIKATTMPG
jgi:hypothetical protein